MGSSTGLPILHYDLRSPLRYAALDKNYIILLRFHIWDGLLRFFALAGI